MNRQDAIEGLKTMDFNNIDNYTIGLIIKTFCTNTEDCHGCPFLDKPACRTIDGVEF